MGKPNLAERRPIPRLGLSRAELAIAIGVSTGSVDKMVGEGVLPRPRIWHSRKIWLVSEVEAYLSDLPAGGDVPEQSSSDWLGHLEQSATAKSQKSLGPVEAHYCAIGFDPKMMSDKDYSRLCAEARTKWLAEIPGLPLNKLEVRSLQELAEIGPDIFVPCGKIKGCGPNTAERLVARGFIKVKFCDNEPDRVDSYLLTHEGFTFIESRAAKRND